LSVQGEDEDEDDDEDEDEDESAPEDKTASKPLYSRRFLRQSCKASLNYRSGNLEAAATVAIPEDDSAAAGVKSADEASGNDSQETSANSSNSAQDDDVSLESVD